MHFQTAHLCEVDFSSMVIIKNKPEELWKHQNIFNAELSIVGNRTQNSKKIPRSVRPCAL